jgi:hypothetical protein
MDFPYSFSNSAFSSNSTGDVYMNGVAYIMEQINSIGSFRQVAPERIKFCGQKKLKGSELFNRKVRRCLVTRVIESIKANSDFRSTYNIVGFVASTVGRFPSTTTSMANQTTLIASVTQLKSSCKRLSTRVGCPRSRQGIDSSFPRGRVVGRPVVGYLSHHVDLLTNSIIFFKDPSL